MIHTSLKTVSTQSNNNKKKKITVSIRLNKNKTHAEVLSRAAISLASVLILFDSYFFRRPDALTV